MEDHIDIVRDYYDSDVLMEWNRLGEHPFEFELTVRMMNRYIKPGDSILAARADIRFILPTRDATLRSLTFQAQM